MELRQRRGAVKPRLYRPDTGISPLGMRMFGTRIATRPVGGPDAWMFDAVRCDSVVSQYLCNCAVVVGEPFCLDTESLQHRHEQV